MWCECMHPCMCVCIYRCTTEALFTFWKAVVRSVVIRLKVPTHLVSCSGDLSMTKGGSELFFAEKINCLTSKDFQCSGADTDVPFLEMHLLMSRKMRMITTDTSSTTVITHSHKYFLRRLLVILLKYGNGFKKTVSWNYNQMQPVKQKNCDCSSPLVLMIGKKNVHHFPFCIVG